MLHTLADFLRFYALLPVPDHWGKGAAPDFRAAAWGVPAAGAVIGGCGALAFLFARGVGLELRISAALAVCALALVTGALHEDGLADVADGFGGGVTRERKLAIMRDSRLGAYGVSALFFSFSLRILALAALAEHGVGVAVGALIAVGAVSRTAGLAPLILLAPARADGLGVMASAPAGAVLARAFAVAVGVSLAPVLFGLSVDRALGADVVALMAALLATGLARRQIGGYTGDVLGAAQQAAEIGGLLALSVA